jgi:5,10-methenyltetrahydrofolate synthetase
MSTTTTAPEGGTDRAALRRHLLAARDVFGSRPEAGAASLALAGHLKQVLGQLEPTLLGVYSALGSEFNAVAALLADSEADDVSGFLAEDAPWALPFALKAGRAMHYRLWDGEPSAVRDECGIASCEGPEVVPDVVLVPCVGYTPSGYRLGYGGGYFDRWLAKHPHVTAIGVAWSCAALTEAQLPPEPHDQPLALVVTEQGVVGG